MKYISKKLKDAATGGMTECHAIDSLNINFAHGYTTVEIGAYVTAETFKNGLKSMSTMMFTLREAPNRDVCPYEWALTKLLSGFEVYDGENDPSVYANGKVMDTAGGSE